MKFRRIKILTLLLTLMSTPCMARDLDSPDILKGYWRLNSNATDYSGWGNDGTWAGDEAYGTAPWGQTVGEFGGGDDYVDINATVVSNSAFTITAWIKSDTAGTAQAIVGQWASGESGRMDFLKRATNILSLYFGGAEIVAGSTTISANVWYFVIATYDGSTATIYINGAYENSASYSSGVSQTDTIIGNYDEFGSEFFNGQIAEVRIYNIALTADEIQTLYQLNLPDYSPVSQPIDTIPDVSDSTLKGAWLSKAVVGGKDLSSNNNDGTATSVGWEEVGGDFDGTNSLITVADSTSLDSVTTAMTLSAWIYPDTTNQNEYIVEKQYTYGMLFRDGSPDYVRFSYYDQGDTIRSINGSSTNWLPNQWQQIVITTDTTDVNFYLNGELTDTESFIGTSIRTTANPAIIGSTLDGSIKDVRIYSEAKTASWIANEYAKSVPDNDLVLHVVDGDKDLSRYDHTLTNSGAILGDGMEFDGSSGNVIVTRTSELDFSGQGDITYSGWINPRSDGEQNIGRILVKGSHIFRVVDESGGAVKVHMKVDYGAGTDATAETTSRYPINSWIYVSMVWDLSEKTATIYIDGEAVAQTQVAGSGTMYSDTGDNIYIGNSSSDTVTFDGTITDLRIYNTAKSAGWVKQDYLDTRIYY